MLNISTLCCYKISNFAQIGIYYAGSGFVRMKSGK
jgi:hypothetical protein